MNKAWPYKITYGQLLDFAVEKWGDSEAIIFQNKRFSYSQLQIYVDVLAKGLINIGIKKGDKVSLWLNNCPEWIFFFYALAKIGAVLVPVNTRFKEKELEYVLRQSDSSALIIGQPYHSTNYYDILKRVIPEIEGFDPNDLMFTQFPYLKHVITVGGNPYPGTSSYDELINLGSHLSDEVLKQREKDVYPDDLFNIIYTSGTTGFPKGAMHSHKMIANMRNAASRLEMSEQDRILLFLPLFHVFGNLAGLTAACTKGAGIVLMEAFEPGASLKLIEEEKITLIYAFETMFFDMLRHPNYHKYSRSSLRSGICPVPPFVAKEVLQKFCHVANAYGMTETTSLTSLSLPNDSDEKIIHTNGFPLPELSIKILDPETGEDLPANQIGELCVKGHPVMLGYYKKPEETKKVMDKDGWFHTGDRAYLDEEGYLHIVGRIKDMIRVGGENVDPVEVESLLSDEPSVYRVSVVATPDDRLGEVCTAFIQLREGYTRTEQELIDYCKKHISHFKVPRSIEFIEQFPMTPTGKIQKFILREWAKKREINL